MLTYCSVNQSGNYDLKFYNHAAIDLPKIFVVCDLFSEKVFFTSNDYSTFTEIETSKQAYCNKHGLNISNVIFGEITSSDNISINEIFDIFNKKTISQPAKQKLTQV